MHLRSITLKGFKSFPDRTRLDFSPGVSVVVGPNGSGKSNITDAVLWAMGEQSPVAVRGQSMQDVIFAGAHGVQARSEAEVEVVLDNASGAVDLPAGEISIVRRLNRAGEGEYRVNGARCRLTDVLELLSDTGLGKEMHSVVSQGRVEAIVTSKPRDRRMLIEEAAGLGKHRKRRRRAQLKLARTQDNLDRALDVEREARSRLRPLEAPGRGGRAARAARAPDRRGAVGAGARGRARGFRRRCGRRRPPSPPRARRRRRPRPSCTPWRRGASRRRTPWPRAATSARASPTASTRRARRTSGSACARSAPARPPPSSRTAPAAGGRCWPRSRPRPRATAPTTARSSGSPRSRPSWPSSPRTAASGSSASWPSSRQRRADFAGKLERLAAAAAEAAERRREADAAADAARAARREAETAADAARREAARTGAELAKLNQFLRTHAGAPGGAPALADDLGAEPGYELALAAALGPRLRAAVAGDLAEGARLLDRAGADGGAALIVPDESAGAPADDSSPAAPTPDSSSRAPAPGAEPLVAHVRAGADGRLAAALLADVWVVDSFDGLAPGFAGVAVTRDGRVWSPATRELRQVPAGGEDRVLAERNRRDALVADVERAAQAEQAALAAVEEASRAVAGRRRRARRGRPRGSRRRARARRGGRVRAPHRLADRAAPDRARRGPGGRAARAARVGARQRAPADRARRARAGRARAPDRRRARAAGARRGAAARRRAARRGARRPRARRRHAAGGARGRAAGRPRGGRAAGRRAARVRRPGDRRSRRG